MEPDATEQGVQHESHHVSIDQHPKFVIIEMTLNLDAIPMMIQMILEEYKKFCHSYQRIFDGPMAYVTSAKMKTNMF